MGWWEERTCKITGRRPKPVYIEGDIEIERFVPKPPCNEGEVVLDVYEVEALRLIDKENLTQEEAGKKMGVSRGTIWRIVKRAREKIIDAIIDGKVLVIKKGKKEKRKKLKK